MSELIVGVVGVPGLAAALRVPVRVRRQGWPDEAIADWGVAEWPGDTLVGVEGTAAEIAEMMSSPSSSPFPVFVGGNDASAVDLLRRVTPAVLVVGSGAVPDGAIAVPSPTNVGSALAHLPGQVTVADPVGSQVLDDVVDADGHNLPLSGRFGDDAPPFRDTQAPYGTSHGVAGGVGAAGGYGPQPVPAAPNPGDGFHGAAAQELQPVSQPHGSYYPAAPAAAPVYAAPATPAPPAPAPAAGYAAPAQPVPPVPAAPMWRETLQPEQPPVTQTQPVWQPIPAPPAQPAPAPAAAAPIQQPTPARAHNPQPIHNLDPADVFTPAPVHQQAAGTAQVVIVYGGKGGIGKTSISHTLAATAAAQGVRTVLVDANIGQGDQRLTLGIPPRVNLPSILDAALTGNPAAAVASPPMLAAARPNHTLQPQFALVPAPPAHLANHPQMTPRAYLDTIRFLTGKAELIVIDTQIVEDRNQDMFTDLILPLLVSGAWGIGISDSSVPGVLHLNDRLKDFASLGVPPQRQMYLLNRFNSGIAFNLDALTAKLARLARFIGVIPADPTVATLTNAGEVLVDVPVMAHWIETILAAVVGTSVTTAAYDPDAPGEKSGLFGRRKQARK